MDNAAELQKVELVDATGNGTMLSVDPAKNPMLAEAKARHLVLLPLKIDHNARNIFYRSN